MLYDAVREATVKRTTTIVGLLAAAAAIVGILAYVLADGGGSGSSITDGNPGPRKKGATAAWLGGATFEGPASGREGGAGLTPEQEKAVQAALERLGNETAIRAAFTAGVAEPWSLAEARSQFERCVPTVERGLPKGGTQDPAAICACAVRAFQGVYPRAPPDVTKSKVRRMADENMRAAVDECMNP